MKDLSHFPFDNCLFKSVTFIGSLNHAHKPLRDTELAEAYRCLKLGGNIIVTMGNPLAEILAHRFVALYDRIFGTNYDMDSERGMNKGEAYYLTDSEIIKRLKKAGFRDIRKKYFWTQFGLNHLFVGWKK